MELLKKHVKPTKESAKTPILRRRATRVRSNSLERERLVSLINSMGDGVIAVDTKLRVVVYNGAALNILDSNTSMDGKKIDGLLRLYDKVNKPVNVAELITGAKFAVNYRDYIVRYSDNTKANLYVSIAPVHLGFGQKGTEGYVVLLRDITREKSLEDERDEFISVVSHELRTPIAISEGNISNALFVTEKTGDIEQIKKALISAHEQVLFLADMINDLATLSRAERGTLTLELEEIDVAALVADLGQDYTESAAKKDLQFTAECVNKTGMLVSSPLYVREILQNFITNAIKYTEKGSVALRAAKTAQGIRFTVSDTGIGISKADQEKVFDKFFRSEDFHTRATTGTGLGLYVTMKLANMLKAEIGLTSTVGKGSEFTIDIPSLS